MDVDGWMDDKQDWVVIILFLLFTCNVMYHTVWILCATTMPNLFLFYYYNIIIIMCLIMLFCVVLC